jgi:phosphoglycerate dehydrogenase-like enzyme
MTPHVSTWTDGMLAARAKHIAENIYRTARREPPMHLIPADAELGVPWAAIGADLGH